VRSCSSVHAGMIKAVKEPGGAGPELTPSGRSQKSDLAFRVSIWAMIVVLLVRSPANLLILGWFTETYRDTAASSEVSHRLHEVAFGIFFSLALVGAISQIASAKRNLAGLGQLIVTLMTLAVVVTVTLGPDYWFFLFLVPLAGVVAFHGPIRPIREGPIQIWAVYLVVLATPTFVFEVASHVAKAAQNAQNHTTHWSVMAAFYIAMVLLAVGVTLRTRGYKLVGWSLGLASVVFGAASFAFPYDASSHRRAFSVFLILWGLSWIIGTVLGGRVTIKSRLVRTLGIIGAALSVPILLMFAVIIVPIIDTPPNVPHRPNPNIQEMSAGDVDRATCLECHGSGVAGAPVIPHETDRTCEDELCWGGRSDCAGCHRIDPALGGPTEQISVSVPTDFLHLSTKIPLSGEALFDGEMAMLRDMAKRP
jgi:hypothetical protein